MKALPIVIFLALPVLAQNPTTSLPAQSACGPMNTQFQIKLGDNHQPEAQLEADKAVIYVVEDQKFKAIRDVTVRVGVDGAWVGATRGDSYLSVSLDPGDHHLCVDWTSDWLSNGRMISLFGFTAEPGKVYYFRARTTGGVGSLEGRNGQGDTASLDLDLVNVDEGKLLVTNAQLSVSHPKK
jgi:hypothetical protein